MCFATNAKDKFPIRSVRTQLQENVDDNAVRSAFRPHDAIFDRLKWK